MAAGVVMLCARGLAQQDIPQPTPLPTLARTEAPPAAPFVEDPASNPRPTPTPVPFLAPLSLRKSLELLERVESLLPTGDAAARGLPPDAPVYSLQRMILSVYNYMEFRDDLHTSLADYQWVLLGRGEVNNSAGETASAIYRFNPPVEYISALSFEVGDADAFLHRVVVYDEAGQVRETFVRKPAILLQHSLPRREVFHIWRRTTISRVEMEFSRANVGGKAPVVVMRGGITQKPEYIKTAMYWLRIARTSLDENNVPAARQALTESRRNIERYLSTTTTTR